MTAISSGFQEAYTTALLRYVVEPGEEGLEAAYELGRRAVGEQLSVLELSAVHHALLADLMRPPISWEESTRIADSLGAFFNESLSAFEMVQRGFGEVQKLALLEKQYAHQLRSLSEGSTAIISTFSVAEILRRLAELAPRLVDARLCLVVTAPEQDWSRASIAAVHAEQGTTMPGADLLDRLYAQALIGEGRASADMGTWGEGEVLITALAGPEVDAGLVVVSGKRGGSFSERDESVLRQLTQTCSVAIERSRLYERQLQIAETLQITLLPEALPSLPGLEVATRYLPGGRGENVGGDWFDAVILGKTRIGLAIGDVAGHGVRAASEMGQVRTAFRAYALEHRDPGRVLTRMAELLSSQNPQHFSTVAYMVLNMHTKLMQLARAGHLPPLIIHPDGTCRYFDEGLSPPLGVAPGMVYKHVELPLSSGCTIVLFTDGLLGRQDPDEAMARIRGLLEGKSGEPEAVCERMLEATPADSQDDVAVLVARLA
jgi:hypothetical protein